MPKKCIAELHLHFSYFFRIHGHIKLPAVAVAIIDTPQFQRLRFLKQVGSCHFVYPNATHTRFQHSVGVGYLAYKFADKLRKENPDLIDEKDCQCVMLAGLCHDLGHGPLSHLWEGFVKEASQDNPEQWHHEDTSIQMLDYLIQDNDLTEVLLNLAQIDATDILFIKECIAGPLDLETGLPLKNFEPNDPVWRYRGRPESKSFLYEIVANKISGLDVDKWDYLQRDDYFMKVGTVFDFNRLITFSKVVKTGNPIRRRICIRDKEAEAVAEMYLDRARLHKSGYQHRVTKIVDRMMVDVWLLANEEIRIKGDDGKKYKLSDAWKNIVAFEKLTDDLFSRIKDMDSDDPGILEAQFIIKRILKRDFYREMACLQLSPGHLLWGKSESQIQEIIRDFIRNQSGTLNLQEIAVLKSAVRMGINPIHKIVFYDKNEQIVRDVTSETITRELPGFLQFETIYVVYKGKNNLEFLEAANLVKDFMKNNNIYANGDVA